MEKIMSFILEVSHLLTAFGVIFGVLVAVEKKTQKKVSSWLLKPVFDEMKELKIKLKEIEKDNLKLIITSETMPMEERLKAGERYIANGGNSAVKIQFKELERQYSQSLRKEEKE